MVAQDLLAVGALDLGFCGSPAIFGEPKNGVVVLSLSRDRHKRVKAKWLGIEAILWGHQGEVSPTFQSFASRDNIIGSSGSLISSSDSFSTFLALF